MSDAVCIASGPSLMLEDVEMVKHWRQGDRFVIVANTTFRAAPWADAMIAVDEKWWKVYGPELETFKGQKLSAYNSHGFGQMVSGRKGFIHWLNSGAAALAYCCTGDFDRIIMLGYDCKGSHWHEDHPAPLNNCNSMNKWPAKFQQLRNRYRNANIINASRQTALTMFPRMRLEDALHG